jgi:hypothetical protein
MKNLKQRITPSLLISSLALFIALGGASYAALGKNSVGSKQIKNNAVTTKKIKNNAVNGAKVNEATLGAVPSATTATTATSAVSAQTAAQADQATLAAKLTGYRTFPQTRLAATAGPSEAAARSAAPETLMFTAGPTTIYAKCYTDTTAPADTFVDVYIKTSENGVVFDSDDDDLDGSPAFLNTDTIETDRELLGTSATLNSSNIDADSSYATHVFTPGGLSYEMQPAVAVKNGTLPGGNGLFGAGDACLVSGSLSELSG